MQQCLRLRVRRDEQTGDEQACVSHDDLPARVSCPARVRRHKSDSPQAACGDEVQVVFLLDSAAMSYTVAAQASRLDRTVLGGIAAVSAALLMTELALTRIFSVTMYYHFAFLAISIALFGLSASGVFVYSMRRRLAAAELRSCLAWGAVIHAAATMVALACLVRIRVVLNYSP